MIASAAAGSVELTQTGGRVALIGPEASKVAGLPSAWRTADVPVTADLSTTGTLAVTGAYAVTPAKGQRYTPDTSQPVAISTRLLAGKGGTASFRVATSSDTGQAPQPVSGAVRASAAPAAVRAAVRAGTVQTATVRKAAATAAASAVGSPDTPVSADRTCAIPLDDPTVQAYQPSFQQVEWAADQAVQGTLTDTRPAGLYGSSISASYTPQGMFPLPSIDGGGSLPAQVLLGVLTQESNLQQASEHVIQGETSNPLSSFNWYGDWTTSDGETTDTGLIDWSQSDCGYGIGQITTGMCLAQGQNNDNECAWPSTLTSDQQLAIAIDYQANIAAAAELLVDEWNTLWGLGITPDGTDVPSGGSYANYIGEWYMAIWAYNSGVEPGSPKYGNTTGCTPGPTCTDNGGTGGNWGLGYADNPINPAYPPDRPVFPNSSSNTTPDGSTYSVAWDTSHPQYWPYQEKVISWAFDSITLYDYSSSEDVQAFAFAHGNAVQVPYDTFCSVSVNNCDASGVDNSSATASDSCLLANDHCWWNQSASWPIEAPSSSCSDCGTSVITYAAGAADPGQPTIQIPFQQTCYYAGPSNAVLVGDGGQSALGCTGGPLGEPITTQGSFSWNFAEDDNGNYSSKIYFDQIGAGFGGHFWFGYAQTSSGSPTTVISGTWNPPTSVSGWTDVQVQIPSYGAYASGAVYQISPGPGLGGWDVPVNQGDYTGQNTWVDLGQYDLSPGATVTLSNVTDTPNPSTGVGSDLAWSVAAFVPVSGPTYDYASLGDSYASGEGNPPYDSNSDSSTDSCDRSPMAYGRQFAASDSSIGNAGIQHVACSGATIANLTTTASAGEPADQISQMSTSVKLATVTIGGNDLGFANILSYCLTNQNTCESEYNSDNGSNLYTIMDLTLKPELVAAYQAMQARAPGATIVAVTYPQIFQPGASCLGDAYLPVPDVQFLISVGLYLDNTIIAAAQQAGIDVLDERYALLGHQICSSDPWVYGLDSALTPGEQFLDTSALFHPTAEGQGQMASDLEDYWKAIQAGGAPAVWPQSLNPNPSGGWLPDNLPNGIPTTVQAEEMLDALPTIANPPTPSNDGYSSSNFGTWPGTRNGWTTRNTVLAAQALTTAQGAPANVAVGNGNVVYAGTWQQPYDTTAGAPTTPVVNTWSSQALIAANLPVDHFVPMAYAWVTGADTWPDYSTAITITLASGATEDTTQGQQMLYDFSNDLSGDELLIVGNSSNSAKGANPPEDWMPSNQGMYCAYAKMWIEVKWQWNLAVATADIGTFVFPDGTTGLSEQGALQYLLNNYC
jgi:hypothetical protein